MIHHHAFTRGGLALVGGFALSFLAAFAYTAYVKPVERPARTPVTEKDPDETGDYNQNGFT